MVRNLVCQYKRERPPGIEAEVLSPLLNYLVVLMVVRVTYVCLTISMKLFSFCGRRIIYSPLQVLPAMYLIVLSGTCLPCHSIALRSLALPSRAEGATGTTWIEWLPKSTINQCSIPPA